MKDCIRILHIITGLQTGGAENMLCSLLSLMDNNRFMHRVVSLTDAGEPKTRIERMGIEVDTLGMPRGMITIRAMNHLRDITNQFSPDIITSWMYHSNIVAILQARKKYRNIPICWKIHHSLHGLKHEKLITKIVIHINALLSSIPKSIIFDSNNALEQHCHIGFNSKRSIVLPIGFDSTLFAPDARLRQNFRLSIGLKSDDLAIGIIGRYSPLKDHKTFLHAAHLVAQKFPAVIFILAGNNVDKQNKELADVIESFKIEKNVMLLGVQNDIRAVYASLDIFCLSSLSEGFPTVVGEAMAFCLPCVVTDVGDAGYLVGDTGIIVPPHNPIALANALCSLLELEDAKRKALGNAARQRIISQFRIEDIVRKYEDHYIGMISSNVQQVN